MSDGNRRDDAAFHHLVGQFAGRPVRHGPARFLGRFAGHRDDPRLLDFVEYFKRTMAKPYKWTYAGRPLNV